MGFSIGEFFFGALLAVNAVAILNEERFLARIGWGQQQEPSYGGDQSVSVKAKIINLVGAVRTLLRIPLIIVNAVVIVYQLLLG